MAFIVGDACVKCKLTDCVEVCPVDCFYEGPNMLVINPDECIDCGVCEPECPIDAIVSDDDPTLQDKEKWLSLNDKYSRVWPNISKKKDPLPDHKKFENETDKYAKYFKHIFEGTDDMTSHIKSSLLGSSISFPLKNGIPQLGVWQGIYLCKNRNLASTRKLVITITGN